MKTYAELRKAVRYAGKGDKIRLGREEVHALREHFEMTSEMTGRRGSWGDFRERMEFLGMPVEWMPVESLVEVVIFSPDDTLGVMPMKGMGACRVVDGLQVIRIHPLHGEAVVRVEEVDVKPNRLTLDDLPSLVDVTMKYGCPPKVLEYLKNAKDEESRMSDVLLIGGPADGKRVPVAVEGRVDYHEYRWEELRVECGVFAFGLHDSISLPVAVGMLLDAYVGKHKPVTADTWVKVGPYLSPEQEAALREQLKNAPDGKVVPLTDFPSSEELTLIISSKRPVESDFEIDWVPGPNVRIVGDSSSLPTQAGEVVKRNDGRVFIYDGVDWVPREQLTCPNCQSDMRTFRMHEGEPLIECSCGFLATTTHVPGGDADRMVASQARIADPAAVSPGFAEDVASVLDHCTRLEPIPKSWRDKPPLL